MRKRKSINRKLITILLLCFLLPFIFETVYVSRHLSKLVEDKIMKTNYKSMENSTLLFSNALQTQFDVATYYKSDVVVVKSVAEMQNADIQEMKELQLLVKERLVKDNSIEKYRYPFYFTLFDYQGNMMTNYTHTPYGGYQEIYEKAAETEWFQSLKESYTDSTVLFSGKDFLNDKGTEKLYIATNIFKETNIGILIFATDISYLHSQFSYVLPESSGFIVERNGKCISEAPKTSLEFEKLPTQELKKLEPQLEKAGIAFMSLKGQDEKYVIMRKSIVIKGYSRDLYLLTMVPIKSIMGEVDNIRVGSIGILMLYVVGIIGIIILLKKTIVMPIRSLCDSVQQVQEGNLQVRIKEMPDNELGELGEGFNMMVENLNVFFENLKKNEEEKRITEIRLLQNQIKPHFVRNVLNTIRWLAEINGVTSVSKSVMALSSLLDYNFRDSNQICTVSDEINYVQKYIYLQDLRFQNKFKAEYDIQEELYMAPILKLSFQPIVENCIYHGLLGKEGLGTISIKGRKSIRGMEFTISDDGVGMEQEKADAALRAPTREGIYEDSKVMENIALWNINQRIKRKYGDSYGLAIQSKPGEGTTVVMRMPAAEETEEGML